MFLFESSKEKEIRLNVQRNMQICISNPKKYNQSKQLLLAHIRNSDQKSIEMIVDNIKATIKNQDLQPIRKYQAILLLKDLMLSHNKALGKYVVKKILKRLTILAQHKSGGKEEKEQERGKDIFGSVKKDQQTYAVKFLNTLLVALEEWGKNWPKTPDGPYKDFHRQYNDLLMNQVQFPKQKIKQQSKSIPSNRQREQNKSVSKSVSKEDLSQKKYSNKEIQKRPTSKQNELKLQISNFFLNIADQLVVLNEMIQFCDAQGVSLLKDVFLEFTKSMEKGNQYKIKLENQDDYEEQQIKIDSLFDLLEKISKDLRILDKKPQQLSAFKTKYIKITKRIIQTIKDNKSALKTNKISSLQKPISNSNSNQQIQIKKQNSSSVVKSVEPQIKKNNRYVSVNKNNQILVPQQILNLQKIKDFASNSGQSVHSDRYGSFGGPGVDKNRGSESGQVQEAKDKIKSNSDRKASQFKKQSVGKHIENKSTTNLDPISQSKQDRKGKQIKQQNKNISEAVANASKNSLFKEFEEQAKQKIDNPFKDSDSFGGHNFPKQPSVQQIDFFQKVQNHINETTNNLNKIQRRRKNSPPPIHQPQHIFDPHIKSQIDSEGLSAFSIGKDQSASINKNIPQSIQKIAVNSKKQIISNPILVKQNNKSQASSKGDNSNFFDLFDFKGNQNMKKSSVGNKSVNFAQKDNSSQKKSVTQNPFETGNFGNMMSKKHSANPFESESIKRQKQINNSFSNPFKEDSFENKSKGSNRQNSNSKDIYKNNNPFESKVQSQIQNPFETSTHKSNKSKNNPFDQIQQFFKPPQKQNIDDLSQRNSFKKVELEVPIRGMFQEPIRDSLAFSAKFEPDEQPGLNFSQFQDIGKNNKTSIKDPFRESQPKANEMSGFSLSNFPPIDPAPIQQNTDPHNASDFFSKFQKNSVKSVTSNKQKQSINIFDKFNFDKSLSQKSQKSNNINGKIQQNNNYGGQMNGQFQVEPNKARNVIFPLAERANGNVMERQKTVRSSQKSFDFEMLNKNSAIAKKVEKEQREFDQFEIWVQPDAKPKAQQGQMFVIDNHSQKQLSWGEFDQPKQNYKDDKTDRDKSDEEPFQKLMLQVESKLNLHPKNDNINEQNTERAAKAVKFNDSPAQPSLQLNLEDFTPITKKGLQWNPLMKINLKVSPVSYNIDQKKIEAKKKELQSKKQQYQLKLTVFKTAKDRSQQVRNFFAQKMKKIQELRQQREEYSQILAKLKEGNDAHQKQISQLHNRIRGTEQLKERLLCKQKQLFDLTRNQINMQERRSGERSMASKWELFNKTLQHRRNNALSAGTSRYSRCN